MISFYWKPVCPAGQAGFQYLSRSPCKNFTSMPIDQLLGSALPFLEKLFHQLAKDGIAVSDYEMDHICYRVASESRYEALKQQLLGMSSLLGETMIGGRPIATFRLAAPIRFRDREVWVLELPAPKPGSPYPEGYEHVEFVIDGSFEDFMGRYPQLTFQTKAMQKPVNADIQLEYDGFGVKFHRQSLEYVIKYLDA